MSDTTKIPEKVLFRIQKLLRMANDGRGNENEAANAAALAQSIVSEYGLELAQIEMADATQVQGGKRERKTHDRAAMYSYQRVLLEAVANMNFCQHMTVEVATMSCGKMRRAKRHVLLGRDIYVQASMMMYDYLVETMDRLLPWQGQEKRGKQALLWLDGCSDRLANRLRDKKAELVAESERKQREDEARSKHPGAVSSGTSLVLSDVYSSEEDYNTDFNYGWEPGTTARKRLERKAQHAAYMAERANRLEYAKSQGWSTSVATYYAAGYNYDQSLRLVDRDAEDTRAAAMRAEKAAKREQKPETEKQRRAREERAERDEANYFYRQAKANQRKNTLEYQMGHAKGDDIGLDKQVNTTTRDRIA